MATVSKRGNGYKITISCGYDLKGKQIRKSMTWTPDAKMTERQIKKELERQKVLFEEKCHGNLISNSNIKFEALAKEFLDNVEKNNLLRPKSIAALKQNTERTYQALGHLRMDKITNRHIQAFINNLAEPGVNKKYKNKGLSPKTQRHYLNFISDIFEYAIKNQIVNNNPCKIVTLPPLQKEEAKCYSLEEAQQFFDTLYEHAEFKYQLFFTLAALGGFRRGELCGLEWSDINYDEKLIKICRTSIYIPNKGIKTDTTKTINSKRCLKLPDVAFELAKKLQDQQKIESVVLGDRWINSNRVFTTWCGTPIHPDTPYKFLIKFCEKYNLTKTSVHQLRHFNASILIRNNIDVRTVASALGHAKPTTTLNFYAHAFAEAQAKASEAIADVINLKKA